MLQFLRQDRRVMETQEPKASALRIDEDRRRRAELQNTQRNPQSED